MKFFLLLLSLFVFLAFTGCGVPNKAIKFTPSAVESPLSDSQTMWDHDKILNMVAKVSIISPREKWFFKLGFFIQRPDKLRVEFIPVFGLPDFFLTIKGNQFKAFLPKKQEFIIGKASPENLAPFVPMLWEPEKWIAVLLGICPDGISYPQQISLPLPDGQEQKINYTWGWRFEDMEIPENITLNTDRDTTLSITYIHFDVHENATDDLFDIPIPDDSVTVHEWH